MWQRRCSPRVRTRLVRTLAGAAIGATALAGCTVGSPSPGSAGGGGHTLVIAEWNNPPAVEATKQVDAEFEKAHPGVTIDVKTAPTAGGAWDTLLNTQLQAQSLDIEADYPLTPTSIPPANVNIAPGEVAAQIVSGQIASLTGQPFLKDYDPTTLKSAVTYKGKVYGVPAAQYLANGVWYKPALLAKYNLPVPATYAQFVSELKTLKGHGLTPIFVAGKDDLESGIFNGLEQQLLMQDKPSSQSPQISVQRANAFWNGTQSWTDPVYQQAGAEYEQIMKYVEPGAAGVSQASAPGVWAASAANYPFFIDGSWDGSTIQQANPSLKFEVMALPATNDPSADRMPLNGDLTWFVPSWAPDKQLAIEWLAMFSQKSNYQKFLDATGSVSTQPGVSAQSLPWMTWENQHAATAFPLISAPWAPTGASPYATSLNLSSTQPFGSESMTQSLATSENFYRQARGK